MTMEHFECPNCGPHVAADEEGCCSTCGRDVVVAGCECLDQRSRAGVIQSNAKTAQREFKQSFEIDFKCSALGRMRSTGEMICLLLSLDKEPAEVIIADVIKVLGLSLDDVIGWHNDVPCPKCGVSTHSHKDNGGECF